MKTINEKKVYGCFLVIGIVSIMLCSLASAIGVVSPPSPVRMYPGEERTFLLTLQNIDVDGETMVSGRIVEGSDIASLDKSSYEVSYKSLDTSARLKIKIPESANIGQTYKIAYEFKQVSGGETGEMEGTGAAFATGVKSGFGIEVIEKPAQPEQPAPEESNLGWIVLIIAIAIIIVAVILLLKRRNNISVK